MTWIQPITYKKQINQKPHNLVAINRDFDVKFQKMAQHQEEMEHKQQLAAENEANKKAHIAA